MRTKSQPEQQEGLFEWGRLQGRTAGRCWVRVIPQPDYAVVLVSELAVNPGPSICNDFEALFPAVVEACELDPERTCWIEHWGPFSYDAPSEREEVYHLTRFRWEEGKVSNPSWQSITEAEVEKILGSPIPSFQPRW